MNFATSNFLSKTKQCRTPHEVYYIRSSLASDVFCVVGKEGYYIFTLAWGFRRCSFRQEGQCEGLSIVERVTELAPRFFRMYHSILLIAILELSGTYFYLS